jgi:hypothetical protein
MNKNTQILFFLGFILLCLYLSCKSKEGFATINSNIFETECNAGSNTCNISRSGRSEYNCTEPGNIDYYDVTINNTHSGNFDVSVNGCSDSGELQAPGITPEARPCSHSNTPYTLHGCVSKCNSPGPKVGYNIPNLPSYISNSNIEDVPGGSCNLEQGYLPAIEVCFNQVDGTITNDRISASCMANNGLWYDGVDVNSIKLICGPLRGPNNYSIVGCEQGCLSRINDSGEYTTSSDLNNENKELIQLLDREGDTTILKNSTNSPYSLTETNLTPSTDSSFTMFDVTGTPRTVSFKSNISDPSEQGVNVDFGGNVESQSCDLYSEDDNLRRKYHVSGLFPTCDSSLYECLNFNITYDSNVPMNINDFKTSMSENIGEILGQEPTQDDIVNYQNSLYYYRRYRDNEGKSNIEGQIRCDNDPENPFHCEIFNEDDSTGYTLTENQVCLEVPEGNAERPGFIGGRIPFSTIDAAKAACDADSQCMGFTFNTIGGFYQLVNNINLSTRGASNALCYQKT